MNLNSWWAISYRWLNQWFRRTILWKLRRTRYQALISEQAITANKEVLTREERQRLGELLWILGDGSIYHYRPLTEEERKEDEKMMEEIIEELKAEGRW